jgi:hypothetical protein
VLHIKRCKIGVIQKKKVLLLPSSSNKETSKFPWGLNATETATYPRGREMGRERHEVKEELVCFGKRDNGSNGLNLIVVAIT